MAMPPNISVRTKRIRNRAKRTLAIVFEVPDTPLKPKRPAIIEITRKIIAYCNIYYPPFV